MNRVLRTLIPFRGRFLVRGGFVTSVSLLPGRASAGLGLVSAHHILAASICLIGPGAHYDNMVQAQRPGSATLSCSLCLPRSFVLPRPLHVLVDEAWLTCTITDIKCVLSQRAFDVFCEKFHIPEEVHPVLPDRDSTIHERPARKIGLYIRFFDFANFRLPLSTFLVDILRYFRINISQLSVIGAAKNRWMSFSKRSEKSHVCYTKPLDSLKNWNDHFFWVDEFACPARFSWHTAKNVTRDPAPKATDFNAQDYAILVDHPSPFQKFPEEFLYLVGLSRHYTLDEETYPSFVDRDGEDMDIFAFIRIPDPTKVKVVERERHEGEPQLLEVEQGDYAGGGDGRDTDVQPVVMAADTISEEVVPLQPRRHRKRKTVFVDTGGPSHHSKKLREDYEAPGGPSVSSKSRFAVQRLLGEAVLNAEVRGEPIPVLPFVTSFVSATPEREGEDHIDSVTGLNLRTISAPQRFVISSDSSHHSGANIAEAEVDSFARPFVPIITAATTVTLTSGPAAVIQEKTVKPSVFAADSSSAGGDPNAGVFSDLTGSDFLVSGIRTVIDPEFDLQKVYVPRWSVTNVSRLDDGRVCREMVDEYAPPKFFASIRGMDHDQLFTEFNVVAARHVSLSAEVRMRDEYNIKEKRKLKTVVDEQSDLLKVREGEIESLRAQLLLKEAEAAEAIRLRVEASSFAATEKSLRHEVNTLNGRNLILEKERDALDVKVTDLETVIVSKERELSDSNAQLTCIKSQNDNLANQVHELETSSAGLQEKVTTYANCMEQLGKFQDERMKIVSDKLKKLDTDLVEMALHLEEKFYPHLLTVIAGRRWLLTHGMELATVKCLHSPEYLSTLREAISKAIEKGMQDGLAAGITHGQEGRVLTDVAACNPSAEADYISTLQRLQSVNFSLLAELKSNKDASVETIMKILRLEESLAKRLGLTGSQPHVDQLMVPIHHSPDQHVVGVSALSLSLDVSSSRVRRIKENIAHHRSALRDVFVPLSEPLSITALIGTEGTSEVMPVTTATTTALSVTSASASFIYPISMDDYEVAPAAGQEGVGEDANPFPDVDDAELNIQLECITPTAESTWVDCLHFVYVTLLKVADVLGPWKLLCFLFIWSSRIAACFSFRSLQKVKVISKRPYFSSKFTSVGLSGSNARLRQEMDTSVPPLPTRYVWTLENDGVFSVASIRKEIDGNRFQDVSLPTRWVKSVPIKVNIIAWKVKSNALPTRFNISRRGMDIDSIVCPICNAGVESTNHIFFQCVVVRQIMRKISSWWNIDYLDVNSYEEWQVWLVSIRIQSKLKGVLEGVYYGLWWYMWNFRNKLLFDKKIPKKALIFDNLVSSSFYWCKFRCKASFKWDDWLKNPYIVLV
ncbi:gypsy type transposase [Tanacetum coccineum]